MLCVVNVPTPVKVRLGAIYITVPSVGSCENAIPSEPFVPLWLVIAAGTTVMPFESPLVGL